MKNFSVIAATDAKWGIGKDGLIPWRFPEDFKWFKSMTMGSTCFMGRNTYLELAQIMKGKKELLPGRKCVVITTSMTSVIADFRVTICNDILRYEESTDSVENFFIGGTSIFEFGLSVSDYVYLTAIPGDYDCNVKFPHKHLTGWFGLNREITLSEQLKVNVYERR